MEKDRRIQEFTNSNKPEQEKLSKTEKDHLLRYHSDTPVRLKSFTLGLTVEYTRDPKVGMKFQCCCGKTFTPRSSVARHLDQCNLARSMAEYPHLKCHGFSVYDPSEVQPDQSRDDALESEGEAEELKQDSMLDKGPQVAAHMASQTASFTPNSGQPSSRQIYEHVLHRDECQILLNNYSHILGSQMRHFEELVNGRILVIERRFKQFEELHELQCRGQESRIAMLERRLAQVEHSLWGQGIFNKSLMLPLEPKASNHTVSQGSQYSSNIQQHRNQIFSQAPSISSHSGSTTFMNHPQPFSQSPNIFEATPLNRPFKRKYITK